MVKKATKNIPKLREAFTKKKAEFYETFSQTGGGGGQPDFISLIQNYICTRNTVKILNKDFIKAVRGGGHRFMKLFHKIPLFFKGMLP